MKKLFICTDIEGTTGITDWNETTKGHEDYAHFAKQMTLEVASACKGAFSSGFEEIVIKDAHDSARNIDANLLPEYAQIIRGWCSHPYCMMYGLDHSFDGVVFTGTHDAAHTDTNPLSHTMDTSIYSVHINDDLASELLINCYTAAYENVPVYAVVGDMGVCNNIKKYNEHIVTVPVNIGHGAGTLSMHPQKALRTIENAIMNATAMEAKQFAFPLPKHFKVIIAYKNHATAQKYSFYPGVTQTDTRTLLFNTDDWFEVLRFFHFAL